MIEKKEYLDKAFEMMERQESVYKSSSFWEQACRDISDNILKNGMDAFRSDINNLYFFVPTYGYPGNSFSLDTINQLLEQTKNNNKNFLALEKYLNGELLARADYDVFKTANNIDDNLNILNFSESTFGKPIEHYNFNNKLYSRSSLNYLLGISFLKSHMPNFIPESVLEIGGGFGTLGEILNQISSKNIKYIDIDLPPIFYIAHEYVRNACQLKENDIKLSNLNDEQTDLYIDNLPGFTFLPSWEVQNLKGEIDLFVNFISFQEMEPDIVENYLNIVSNLKAKVILLRNMKEGKQKATKNTVGVTSPVTGEDYSKYLSNYDLVAKNISPFGYTTVDNFNSELLLFKRK